MMLARGYRMSKRRVMAKAKVYGFSPWVDQVDAINQIMKDTGDKNESALLRKLVDEALDTRRKKSRSAPLTEESEHAGVRLETIESLLMRLVRQGNISLRIEDVCLALLQDVLAESYATRRHLWESLVVPQLRDAGIDSNELERRFVLQDNQAKDYAYGEAERIKQSQETGEMRALSARSTTPNSAGSDHAERR
jgi:hypothetical protein